MKKFKIVIYRDGGFFRKYKEEWEIEADYFTKYEDTVSFCNNGKTDCDLPETIAEFEADKYSIIPLTES